MPMFEEFQQAVDAVSRDLTEGFSDAFRGLGSVQAVGIFGAEAVGTMSGSASVVAWEWPVEHVGPLQGTPATGRRLTLRGVTVIERTETVIGRGDDVIEEDDRNEDEDGDLFFSRYIDWLALYAELGAITIARPQVDDRRDLPDNVPHEVETLDQ